MLRVLIAVAITFYFPLSASVAHAHALPKPDPTRVNRAVQRTIELALVRRGFASNDPKFAVTLARTSSIVTSTARTSALVTAGAVTAPAWGSIAIALGISAVIGYAIDLAVEGLTTWFFEQDGTVTQTVYKKQPKLPSQDGIPFKEPDDYHEGLDYLKAQVKDTFLYEVLQKIEEQLVDYRCLVEDVECHGVNAFLDASILGDVYLDIRLDNATVNVWANRGVTVPDFRPCSDEQISLGPFCLSLEPVAAIQHHRQDIGSVVSKVPESELPLPLNPAILAAVADRAWSTAASVPDYSGVPYSVLAPITVADVTAWSAHTGDDEIPIVTDFVTPNPLIRTVYNAVPEHDADSLTSNDVSHAYDTASTPLTSVGHNPARDSHSNLGPALESMTTGDVVAEDEPMTDDGATSKDSTDRKNGPSIDEPTLEVIPTAEQILQPLRNFFPSIDQQTIRGSHGECPKPSFEFAGHQFVMHAHCDLIEEARFTITAAFLAAFALLSLLIVLRA